MHGEVSRMLLSPKGCGNAHLIMLQNQQFVENVLDGHSQGGVA